MFFFRGGGVSTMNLPTKWAYNLLFADKLAKFAHKILLHGQHPLFLAHNIPGGGSVTPPHSATATVLNVLRFAPGAIFMQQKLKT